MILIDLLQQQRYKYNNYLFNLLLLLNHTLLFLLLLFFNYIGHSIMVVLETILHRFKLALALECLKRATEVHLAQDFITYTVATR